MLAKSGLRARIVTYLVPSYLGAYSAVATGSIASRLVLAGQELSIANVAMTLASAIVLAIPTAILFLPLSFIGVYLVGVPITRLLTKHSCGLAIHSSIGGLVGAAYALLIGLMEHLIGLPTPYSIWAVVGIVGGTTSAASIFFVWKKH